MISPRHQSHTVHWIIRAFFKNLEVHNAWCVAGGARPCTRQLRYLIPGAGFSPARSGRGTQSCFQSHTIHWIFELLKKNLKVQRARPVTRGRVPDMTEWGASRVVRGASRVVRARALDPFDTSLGAVVSPARSVRGINHTRYTGYSSFFKKNLEVHNTWCVAGGARPCTRHLLYRTPGAGFSPARSGRGKPSCFNHTLYTGYLIFFKKT